MKRSPEGLILGGAVALMVLLLSHSGGAELAPSEPEANINSASKENRRDPRRRLIPLHERPERPRLA